MHEPQSVPPTEAPGRLPGLAGHSPLSGPAHDAAVHSPHSAPPAPSPSGEAAQAPPLGTVASLFSHWTDAPAGAGSIPGAERPAAAGASTVHDKAAAGLSEGSSELPFLAQLQHAFGREHDLSSVRAHIGGAAAGAAQGIGAQAYTYGNRIAFAAAPSLRLAAHEAAHIIQQRSGVHLEHGVGSVGDAHEQHADAVAERVVARQDAAELLSRVGGGGSAKTAVV